MVILVDKETGDGLLHFGVKISKAGERKTLANTLLRFESGFLDY